MAELKIDITKAVEEIIEKLNAEGYTDVKHGKWEQGKCTNCKKSLEDLFSGDFYWDDDDLHFCPNCGARMDLDSLLMTDVVIIWTVTETVLLTILHAIATEI